MIHFALLIIIMCCRVELVALFSNCMHRREVENNEAEGNGGVGEAKVLVQVFVIPILYTIIHDKRLH